MIARGACAREPKELLPEAEPPGFPKRRGKPPARMNEKPRQNRPPEIRLKFRGPFNTTTPKRSGMVQSQLNHSTWRKAKESQTACLLISAGSRHIFVQKWIE